MDLIIRRRINTIKEMSSPHRAGFVKNLMESSGGDCAQGKDVVRSRNDEDTVRDI